MISHILTFATGVAVGSLSGAFLLSAFLSLFGPQLDKAEARAAVRWRTVNGGVLSDARWSHQPPT